MYFQITKSEIIKLLQNCSKLKNLEIYELNEQFSVEDLEEIRSMIVNRRIYVQLHGDRLISSASGKREFQEF